MRETNAERGFTLIELMVAVAIIAVLAVIVIPQFTKEAHVTKGKTEVNAMFAQLGVKEETYKEEAGVYLAAAECPTNPSPSGYNFTSTCITSGSAWESLRISPPESKMHCTYTIVVGTQTDTLTPPTGFKNSQGTLNGNEPGLATGWWYLRAECDEDNQGGTNAIYYASSVDPTMQITNSGK